MFKFTPCSRRCHRFPIFSAVPKWYLIAALALGLASCQGRDDAAQKEDVAKVGVVSIESHEATPARELVGRVEQTGIAPLAFEVSGQLVEIAVKDGESVRKGDLIAAIEKEPYQLAVAQARDQRNQLTQDLKRSRQLYDEKILSRAAFEGLETQTKIAQSRLSLTERDLRNTRLLAPFDGRISSRRVELWQFVQAGSPAFNLENARAIDISVDIPQSMIHQLKLNDQLQASAWLPERPDIIIPIQFKERSTQGTLGNGIFRLIFSAQTPDNIDVLTGMSVRVRLNMASPQTPEVMWRIPLSAMMIDMNGKYFVWRLDEKTSKAQNVPIEIKEILQDHAIVTSGQFADKQRIVSIGAHFVHEGQALDVLKGSK